MARSKINYIHLPTEVLQYIFSLTKRRWHEFALEPNSKLPNFAVVCKAWLPAARLALYSDLYLYRDDDEDEDKTQDETLEQLKETLVANPLLADLVLSINFAPPNGYSPEGTELVAEIITLCPHVSRLHIQGWNDDSLPKLRSAVAGAKALEHLELFARSMDDRRCDPFWKNMGDFFHMLGNWPNARTIFLHRDMFGSTTWKNKKTKSRNPPADGVCPRLERLAWLSGITDRALTELCRIAPNLRCLHLINTSQLSPSTIKSTVSAYAETLEYLQLGIPDKDEDEDAAGARPYALDNVLPGLKRLRTLHAKPALLLPQTLARGFVALEYLVLHEVKDLGPLQDAITSGLPSLKNIMVCGEYGEPAGAGEFAEGALAKFIDVCAARGVTVKRRGHGYTKVDELAHMMDYPEEMAAEIVEKQNFGIDSERWGGSGMSDEFDTDGSDLDTDDESDYE
ncbi:unnamed protein product [Peniophora sp. CBMAI 1063]|nr:unnamed protein product [Peniophora sp. CBMAI 1063]